MIEEIIEWYSNDMVWEQAFNDPDDEDRDHGWAVFTHEEEWQVHAWSNHAWNVGDRLESPVDLPLNWVWT